jgi:chitinase
LAGSTPSSLTLAWDGATSASYEVLRSGVRIATVTGTSFVDIGLLPNTPYLYSIRGTTTTPERTFTITR